MVTLKKPTECLPLAAASCILLLPGAGHQSLGQRHARSLNLVSTLPAVLASDSKSGIVLEGKEW